MRILFASMGSLLGVFDRLAQHLATLMPLESVSYSISDRRYCERYLATHTPLTHGGEFIRQWEIVERGRRRRPAPAELAAWEARLKIPTLWPALVADRRTYNGRLTKFRQDYAPSFSLAEMQGILLEGLETCWAAFERLQPDVVVGVAPGSFEIMLIYWVARARGVPYLYLRSTKIGNYVKLGSDPLERSDPYTEARYRGFLDGTAADEEALSRARDYLRQARQQRVTYEGAQVRRARPGLTAALLKFGLLALPMFGRDLLHVLQRTPFDIHRYPAFAVMRETTAGSALRIRAARHPAAPR